MQVQGSSKIEWKNISSPSPLAALLRELDSVPAEMLTCMPPFEWDMSWHSWICRVCDKRRHGGFPLLFPSIIVQYRVCLNKVTYRPGWNACRCEGQEREEAAQGTRRLEHSYSRSQSFKPSRHYVRVLHHERQVQSPLLPRKRVGLIDSRFAASPMHGTSYLANTTRHVQHARFSPFHSS